MSTIDRATPDMVYTRRCFSLQHYIETSQFPTWLIMVELIVVGTTTILLRWVCQQSPKEDYAVFVHLVDAGGNTIAQADGVPKNGYYPTDLWIAGDVVDDQRTITLPEDMSGSYRLRIRLYSLATMERLPAYSPEGARLLHDQYVSNSLHVCSE